MSEEKQKRVRTTQENFLRTAWEVKLSDGTIEDVSKKTGLTLNSTKAKLSTLRNQKDEEGVALDVPRFDRVAMAKPSVKTLNAIVAEIKAKHQS